jgi:hypothetical protein
MAQGSPPTGGLFADLGDRCRRIGLAEPAEQLRAFFRLPEPLQAATWADLAERIDRDRVEAGWIA